MTPSPASAVQRLEASRARLRSAWQARRDGPTRGGLPAAGDGLLPWLAQALTSWWNQHPLKGVAQVAADVAEPAARSLLQPEAERHPLRLVAIAAGAGALLMAIRPWRWLPQAALSSLLLGALWPHGSLQRWLSSGGPMRWLASGELSRLLASLAAPPADAQAHASPDTQADARAPAAGAAPNVAPPAQVDTALSYTVPRSAPMAATTVDS